MLSDTYNNNLSLSWQKQALWVNVILKVRNCPKWLHYSSFRGCCLQRSPSILNQFQVEKYSLNIYFKKNRWSETCIETPTTKCKSNESPAHKYSNRNKMKGHFGMNTYSLSYCKLDEEVNITLSVWLTWCWSMQLAHCFFFFIIWGVMCRAISWTCERLEIILHIDTVSSRLS